MKGSFPSTTLAVALTLLALAGTAPTPRAGTKVALAPGASAWSFPDLERTIRSKVSGAGKSKTEEVLAAPGTQLDLEEAQAAGWELRLEDAPFASGASWFHKSPTQRKVRLQFTDADLDALAEAAVAQHLADLAAPTETTAILKRKARGLVRLRPLENGSVVARLLLRLQLRGEFTSPAGTRKFKLRLRLVGESDPVALVDVSPPPPPPHQPLDIDFVVLPLGTVAPLTVNFADQSTGTITGYEWTFGTGDGSTLPQPSYVFEEAGDYPVTLRVSGPLGTEVLTKLVSVAEPFVPPLPTRRLYLAAPDDEFVLTDELTVDSNFFLGATAGLGFVFDYDLVGLSNASTQYNVTLSIEGSIHPVHMRFELRRIDPEGEIHVLFGPIDFVVNSTALQAYRFDTSDGPLMDAKSGDRLELEVRNVTPLEAPATAEPFRLHLPYCRVQVPEF